jgi:hypothetical protein
MKPGDKVRFLRSAGDGIIRKINPDKTADVEIEDGFIIPVLQSEIVVVAAEEKQIFRKAEDSKQAGPSSKIITEDLPTGIYLTFSSFNERLYNCEIINNSNYELLIAVSEESSSGTAKGLGRDIIKQGVSFPFGQRNIQQFNEWPALYIQILYFTHGTHQAIPPYNKRFAFNPATFYKHKKKHPLTGKEAFVFNLEGEKIKLPENFAEAMQSNHSQDLRDIKAPSSTVDLHIEKLTSDFSELKNLEILDIQLKAFEKNLENAIASGMPEITFIHGVGNGVLRNMIHKTLSQNKEIDFYKDAQKEKFGYGATYIKFK